MLTGSRTTKGYVLGYDLGEQFSQISFMELAGKEPKTLSVIMGAEIYDIPTILARREDVNQWFFGKEAERQSDEQKAIRVDNLITLAKAGRPVTVGETEYDPVSLLALFVKRSLSLLSMEVDASQVRGIMFTTASMDDRMVRVLRAVVKALSLPLKHVYFESYAESLFHYTMAQDKDLRQHTVMALDYHYGTLRTYMMSFNFHMTPVVATIDEKTYDDMEVNMEGLPTDVHNREKVLDMLDGQLLKISEDLIRGKVVSTVYLLGNGFKSGWMNRSLEFLCRTRKVFQGSNLFSKGATYAAGLKVRDIRDAADYMLLDEEKLCFNVGIFAHDRGREHYVSVLEGGRNWYDVRGSVSVILESGNSFMIRVAPLMEGPEKELVFPLTMLPSREERTTSLQIDMEMSAKKTLKVTVKDLGFGVYMQPSGYEETKEFEL